jgi:hypothetical protein
VQQTGGLIFVEVTELAFAATGKTAVAVATSSAASTFVTSASTVITAIAWRAVVAKVTTRRWWAASSRRRATWARWALFFGTRFDDLQRTATDGGVVEAFHGGAGFAVIGHVHETKAAGATGFTIFDDACVSHGAISGELVQQLFVCERVRQVANIEVHLNR